MCCSTEASHDLHRWLILACGIAVGCTACAPADPGPEPPEITWEGRWIRYGSDPEIGPTCGGNAAYMDAYVGTLAGLFGVDDPAPIDYFHVSGIDRVPCNEGDGSVIAACVRHGTVWSTLVPQEHELVHAVRFSEHYSHYFVEEGAAELWGDDSLQFPFRSETDTDPSMAAMQVDDGGLPAIHYGVAGRWMSRLAARGELVELEALLRRTDLSSSYRDLEDEFAGAFGRSLDEDFAAFGEEEPCDQREFRHPVHACAAAPRVQWCADGVSLPITRTLSCSDEDALGPRDGEVWTYVTIDVGSSPITSIFVESRADAVGSYVEAQECAAGCGSVYDRAWVMQEVSVAQTFDLHPGRYVLKLGQPADVETHFVFYLQSEDCRIRL